MPDLSFYHSIFSTAYASGSANFPHDPCRTGQFFFVKLCFRTRLIAQAIVPSAPVEDTTYENMLKAWQSGVIGALNYMQAAFPYMKAQHEGRIINFASATGMFGIAGQLAYGSNKEAIRGMTKIAAKEWGQYGICVNVVLPGAESPAAKAWAQKFPEEYAKQINLNPMKRFGDPENDIAPVVAFLAGPDSCYYSGQSVIVDGANSIMP